MTQVQVSTACLSANQRLVPGILGGLGPLAHIEFERCLISQSAKRGARTILNQVCERRHAKDGKMNPPIVRIDCSLVIAVANESKKIIHWKGQAENAVNFIDKDDDVRLWKLL